MLFGFTASAQTFNYIYKDTNNNDSIYKFKYSPILKTHLDDFFIRAEFHGIDLSKTAMLDGVYWSNHIEYYLGTDQAFGLTMSNILGYGFVLINDDTPLYLPTLINAIVYHELYHWYASRGSHCEGEDCPYILRSGDKLDTEEVIKTWNSDRKDEYFLYLKRIMNEN